MANFFKKNKPKRKKQSWEREDRTLDYIASHKGEITRYLIVVLVSEVWRWVLDNVIYNLSPLLQNYENVLTFSLWALPYFIVCKLWVWKQKGDDGYTWGIQGMKFVMTIIIIAVINALCGFVMKELMMLGKNMIILFGHLIEEILYFFAMFKFIIQPEKKK